VFREKSRQVKGIRGRILVADPEFRDNSRDEGRRRIIEGRVPHGNCFRRHLHARGAAELLGGPFFDFDGVAGWGVQVAAGGGRCHEKGRAMVCRRDGQLVGADLVGAVAVRRYPICAHHHLSKPRVFVG